MSKEKTEYPFLAGGGEIGALIRSLDCRCTSLGPPDAWPQPLKTAVGIMLGSSLPIAICWGADLVLLYNDHWRELIGNKHPGALGRPARDVFPETWEQVGPMLADVLDGRGSGRARDQLLPIDRRGQIENAWFSFCFDPIPLAGR